MKNEKELSKEEFLKELKCKFVDCAVEDSLSLPTLSDKEQRKIKRLNMKIDCIKKEYDRLCQKYQTIGRSSALIMSLSYKNTPNTFDCSGCGRGGTGAMIALLLSMANGKTLDYMDAVVSKKAPTLLGMLLTIACVTREKKEPGQTPEPKTDANPQSEPDPAHKPDPTESKPDNETEGGKLE